MNNRGGALANVLIVSAVLMILGAAAFQVVRADANFSKINISSALALQMAEGGIDYGIEMIRLEGEVFGEEVQLDLPEGNVWVTIEHLGQGLYSIVSKAQTRNTTRSVRATVAYSSAQEPFNYSLFVGEESEEIMFLNHITIDGPVYIASRIVIISNNVEFQERVHFESEEIWLANQVKENDWKVVATHKLGLRVFNEKGDKEREPNHWVYNKLIPVNDGFVPFPDIYIELFAEASDFTQWNVTEVSYKDLHQHNYFPGDITVTVDNKQQIPATGGLISIVSNGSVNFDVKQQLDDYSGTLIVMANEDISGICKLIPPGKDNQLLDVYLYAKGNIYIEQNIALNSVMAQEVVITHNQMQTIKEPDPSFFDNLPKEFRDAWKMVKILRWEN